MTMPHLMNCSHSDTGWCLACVKQQHEATDGLREHLQGLVESWADDACRHREPSDPKSDAVAATYQECSDELAALLEATDPHSGRIG